MMAFSQSNSFLVYNYWGGKICYSVFSPSADTFQYRVVRFFSVLESTDQTNLGHYLKDDTGYHTTSLEATLRIRPQVQFRRRTQLRKGRARQGPQPLRWRKARETTEPLFDVLHAVHQGVMGLTEKVKQKNRERWFYAIAPIARCCDGQKKWHLRNLLFGTLFQASCFWSKSASPDAIDKGFQTSKLCQISKRLVCKQTTAVLLPNWQETKLQKQKNPTGQSLWNSNFLCFKAPFKGPYALAAVSCDAGRNLRCFVPESPNAARRRRGAPPWPGRGAAGRKHFWDLRANMEKWTITCGFLDDFPIICCELSNIWLIAKWYHVKSSRFHTIRPRFLTISPWKPPFSAPVDFSPGCDDHQSPAGGSRSSACGHPTPGLTPKKTPVAPQPLSFFCLANNLACSSAESPKTFSRYFMRSWGKKLWTAF